MSDEDDVPTFEIERRGRGWKIVQVQADGRRSFLGDRRYVSADEARAHLPKASPRPRRLWGRLVDRPAR